MTTENGQSKGAKIVEGINDATEIVGTLVPAVSALAGIVRLLVTAVRPTDAQKAQAFDEAIAKVDDSLDKLDTAIAGFDAAKAAAAAKDAGSAPAASSQAAAAPKGKPVGAMGTGPLTKPSEG